VTGWWETETNDNVATKPELWRPLAEAMNGFNLDPAAGTEPEPIAAERYTPEDDGLTTEWYGTVWLNPPFSEKEKWYRRLVTQHSRGEIGAAVAVAPDDTSTDWFHDWFSTADVIAFLDGRDWFTGKNSPNFGTQVGVWTPTPEVISKLQSLGKVVRPVTENSERRQSTLGGVEP
jgi:hypothetical protein